MPTIAMFYGIIIYMYYFDDKKHKLPHIHAQYNDHDAVISIPDGNIIAGDLPANKLKLVLAWIEIRKEELIANWSLAVRGEKLFNIDPLK
jgi:hypothetical protein